jgi:hypothetical protein
VLDWSHGNTSKNIYPTKHYVSSVKYGAASQNENNPAGARFTSRSILILTRVIVPLVKCLTQSTTEIEPTLSNWPTNESPIDITARGEISSQKRLQLSAALRNKSIKYHPYLVTDFGQSTSGHQLAAITTPLQVTTAARIFREIHRRTLAGTGTKWTNRGGSIACTTIHSASAIKITAFDREGTNFNQKRMK